MSASRSGRPAAGCAFCGIAAGEAGRDLVVFRSGRVVGFVAHEPAAFGHTVLAPTGHYADLFDAPGDVVADLVSAAQTVAWHYREAVGAEGVNLLHASGRAAQQSVPHLHVHLLPRFEGDGLDAWPELGDPDASAAEMAARLRLPGV